MSQLNVIDDDLLEQSVNNLVKIYSCDLEIVCTTNWNESVGKNKK